MKFPCFVYKDGGPHQRAGGTYSYKGVGSFDELSAALADGWLASLEHIDNPPKEEPAAKAKPVGDPLADDEDELL